MSWIYSLRQRCLPTTLPNWDGYLKFAGLVGLEELVTADNILCPNLINELMPEDWQHNIQQNNYLFWFSDWHYLRQRQSWESDTQQVIAIWEAPLTRQSPPEYFQHCGFDIVDRDGDISVLTNCGGFPDLYTFEDVNQFGLLDNLNQTQTIVNNLHQKYGDDYHCRECQIWQVARYQGGY